MSNLSTLQRNTLDGLSEAAGILYLKLTDTLRSEQKAFLAACQFEDKCAGVFDYIVRNSPAHDIDAATITELSRFMSERWRNNFMIRAINKGDR